ncbi:response regulator [Paenibacillus sp. YN15]|uniref:response regulator n=1 Tax=Paenibacillus sp. YN15 TaxID=1742774 RepID=UPI000DCEDDFC|nr:response regulator [Paenibacillus sp. YN15]RAU98094.1 hypothetical protein DQG13_17525 [Paenibacillus sp. YN15]
MRLLLVDDELSTREGLLKFVEWGKIGIATVNIAGNGEEALELARSLSPDILMTDIRMPNMDGIELASEIVKSLPSCKIVFISGFADKEYLKSAIRLNALGYVEKPLNIEEVTDTLARAVQACLNDKEKKEYERKARESMDKGIPLLKQKIGSELVAEANGANVLSELEATGFDTSFPWRYITFAVRLKLKPDLETMDTDKLSPERLLSAIFSADKLSPVFSGYSNGGILILHAALKSGGASAIAELAENIREYLETEGDHQALVSIGVGKPVTAIREIQMSFKHAMDAVRRTFFSGYGFILKYTAESVPYKADYVLIEEFSDRLNKGDRAEAVNVVKRAVYPMQQANSADIEKIRVFFLKLFMTLETEMDKRGLQKNTVIDDGNDEKAFMDLDTVAEISDFLLERTNLFFDIIEQKQQVGSSLYDIQEYIKKNYGDSNLSVKSIAEYANYSHYHLCYMFKKQAGTTINNYITQIRMEKAKELLKNKTVKLYEISKKVGYSNPNYFVKLFKKVEGCTPTEFKEKYY